MTATNQQVTWSLSREDGKIGTGNWDAFPKERIPEVFAAAERWKEKLSSIQKPWLCWCVDDGWCYTQQQLVAAAGWTPVVGTDGNVPSPRLVPEAVFLDFNERLQLPLMWMHFPLDFVFLFTDRMAFWHSDVLPPVDAMRQIAAEFESILDGELIGVRSSRPGLRQLIRRFRKKRPLFYKRWFEVIGCTTATASRSQYENGCGWWRLPQQHPNAQQIIIDADPHWEHGVGISLWERHFGGATRQLKIDIDRYHYCASHPDYIRLRAANRKIEDSKRDELARSFDLNELRSELGLQL